MGVVALDHVNIATAKLENTRAFYCNILGLIDGPRPSFSVEGHWLYAGDRAIVHLQRAPPDSDAVSAIRHFALAVDDLAPILTKLDTAGVGYRRTTTPDGVFDQVFMTDPGGALVELICRA